jgi:ATP adenylyltransferase
MQYLAAPWRKPYFRNLHKMTGCIFCRAQKLKNDKDAFILYRGKHSFIILNKFPYLPGHLMIAPYKHLASFEKSGKDLSDEIVDLLKLSLKAVKKNYHPHGFNIGMNLGKSAGAGVADHFHLHVVPRWVGDSNFMPIIGGTKLVIEDLDATFARLYPLFQKRVRNHEL